MRPHYIFYNSTILLIVLSITLFIMRSTDSQAINIGPISLPLLNSTHVSLQRKIAYLIIPTALHSQNSLVLTNTASLSADSNNTPIASNPSAFAAIPKGQRPFLIAKPFDDTYMSPVKLHSFFDHRLPVYENEISSTFPLDLRDRSGITTSIFTGEERTTGIQGYSFYSGHNGIDYGTRDPKRQMTVRAPADGIIFSGREASLGYCKISIKHEASTPPDQSEDYLTFYVHLSSINDAPIEQRNPNNRNNRCGTQWCAGDTIHQGDVIGIEGNDPCGGSSDGTHLHFGVAAISLTDETNPNLMDPFGWWSNNSDPWADSRLAQHQSSYWLWGAPQNPGLGNPGYWGEGVVAQTDDTDASFHRFTSFIYEKNWHAIIANQNPASEMIGTGAWWSNSTKDATKPSSFAVWALHVPDTAEYWIQAYIPYTRTATTNAIYRVKIPLANSTLDIWNSAPVNQQINNQWRDLSRADGMNVFTLQGGSVVLVELSDFTDKLNEAVVFDALRLKRKSPVSTAPSTDVRRVGFVIDNSSSMRAEGKMNAIQSAIPVWINRLEASQASYVYALDAFAENVPQAQITEDPVLIQRWITALRADDNQAPNADCPEASLDAIVKLAPNVQGGNILFFTDDLPKDPLTKGASAFVALRNAQAKLHSIILPKTCSGGNPSGWLTYRGLSLVSGGSYQAVMADKTDEALEIVLSEMQTNAQLGSLTSNTLAAGMNGTIRSAGDSVHEILVDDSISQVNFLLNIIQGSFSFTLFRPNGIKVNANDPNVTLIDSGSAQYYKVLNPSLGTWQVQISGNGEYIFRTSADSTIQFTYLGDVQASPGTMMQLATRVSGVVSALTFELEDTDGQLLDTVELFDKGILGDFSAGDGVYTGIYTPTISGDLRIRLKGQTELGYTFFRTDSRLIRIRNLNITAPPPEDIVPGETHTFNFIVKNSGINFQIYELKATSGFNWISQEPPSTISLAGGEEAIISVKVAVPSNANPNAIDLIHLTAIDQQDRTVIVKASTAVFTPDRDESPSIGSTPGDCNADSAITASDVTALALEFFDGDDNSNPLATSGGAYAGSPACDANEDRQIGASDVTCIARLFFNGPGACRLAAGATVATRPVLSLPSQIAAETNSQVTVPIELRSNGSAVSSLLFSIDYDETTLTFDPADHDQDGVPDAITFHLPAQMLRSVTFDPADHTGELDLMLADFAVTPAALPTGPLVSITLKTGAVAELTTAVVKFADRPAPSFGGIDGQNLAGASEGGTIFIHGPTDLPVLPLKSYLPLVVGQE